MLTFILLGAGIIIVVGLFVLVMRSGSAKGRHGQSGDAIVQQQEHSKTTPTGDLRGSVRSGGNPDL